MNAPLRREAQALLDAHPYAGATLEGLVEILEACPERQLTAGEVLCKERSYGQEMYLLTRGQVEIRKRDLAGNDHLLAVLTALELIGQLSLIDNAIRSASVVARAGAVVRVLDRQTFVRLTNSPTVAGASLRRLLLSSLHHQLSRAYKQLRPSAPGAPPPKQARAPLPGQPATTPAAQPYAASRAVVVIDDPEDTAEIQIALNTPR